jgi:hypothetical protein
VLILHHKRRTWKIINFKEQSPCGEVGHLNSRSRSASDNADDTLPGIDLTSLVPKLDITASDIVAHQRDSLVQRKDLAQKTKDFRKLDDAGKLSEYKSLLKGPWALWAS